MIIRPYTVRCSASICGRLSTALGLWASSNGGAAVPERSAMNALLDDYPLHIVLSYFFPQEMCSKAFGERNERQQYLEGSSPPSALCSDLNSMTDCHPMAPVFSILTCRTTVHSSKSILPESLSTLFRGFDSWRRTSSAQHTPGQEVWLTQDCF